jgi:hypothetical protein
LVNQVLETDIAREKLAGYVEERQVLLSMKRGEALEEGRKKREEKEWLKAKSVDNGATNGHGVDSTGNNQPVLSNGNHIGQNGQIAKNKGEAFSTRPNHASNRLQFFSFLHVSAQAHTLTHGNGHKNNCKHG